MFAKMRHKQKPWKEDRPVVQKTKSFEKIRSFCIAERTRTKMNKYFDIIHDFAGDYHKIKLNVALF